MRVLIIPFLLMGFYTVLWSYDKNILSYKNGMVLTSNPKASLSKSV